MLREYLNSVSEMSVANNRKMFRLIENEYRQRMLDPDYFNTVEEFLNRRKPKAEKEAFCFALVRQIVLSTDLRKKMEELS